MINFDNVVSARYRNADYDIIEVLYKNPDDDRVRGGYFNIHQQPTLLKKLEKAGFDEEKLVDETANVKRLEARKFSEMVDKSAEKKTEEMRNELRKWEEDLKTWDKAASKTRKDLSDWESTLKNYETDLNYRANELGLAQTNLVKYRPRSDATEEQNFQKSIEFEQGAKELTKKMNATVFDNLLEKNANKEELFRLKIWALKQPIVQSSDKTVKSKIRKCKTMFDCFSIINSILNEEK